MDKRIIMISNNDELVELINVIFTSNFTRVTKIEDLGHTENCFLIIDEDQKEDLKNYFKYSYYRTRTIVISKNDNLLNISIPDGDNFTAINPMENWDRLPLLIDFMDNSLEENKNQKLAA